MPEVAGADREVMLDLQLGVEGEEDMREDPQEDKDTLAAHLPEAPTVGPEGPWVELRSAISPRDQFK